MLHLHVTNTTKNIACHEIVIRQKRPCTRPVLHGLSTQLTVNDQGRYIGQRVRPVITVWKEIEPNKKKAVIIRSTCTGHTQPLNHWWRRDLNFGSMLKEYSVTEWNPVPQILWYFISGRGNFMSYSDRLELKKDLSLAQM